MLFFYSKESRLKSATSFVGSKISTSAKQKQINVMMTQLAGTQKDHTIVVVILAMKEMDSTALVRLHLW